MAKEHAKAEKEPKKKHGDAVESLGHHAGREKKSAAPSASSEDHSGRRDAVPMPEDGAHERSHLGAAHGQTKPEGNLRHGAAPGALREPPMEIQRAGKQHR